VNYYLLVSEVSEIEMGAEERFKIIGEAYNVLIEAYNVLIEAEDRC
jgi:hypothetical protein